MTGLLLTHLNSYDLPILLVLHVAHIILSLIILRILLDDHHVMAIVVGNSVIVGDSWGRVSCLGRFDSFTTQGARKSRL